MRAFRLFLTTVLLFVVLRQVDFDLVAARLRGFSLLTLGAALGLQFVMRALMAIQSGISARVYGISISNLRLFEINLIMTFYTLLVPGELVSGGVGWIKMTNDGASKGGALAAMATCRWINTLLLFLSGMILINVDKSVDTGFLQWILVAGAMGLSIGYVLLLSPRTAKPIEKLVSRYFNLSRSSRFTDLGRRFLALWTGFRSMGRRCHWLLFGYGILIHLLGILSHILIVQELHITISWYTIAWIRSLVLILGLLPVSIGGFGVRESSLIYVLGLYSVEKETALAYSMILVATVYGTGIFGGLLELKDALTRGFVPKSARSHHTVVSRSAKRTAEFVQRGKDG